MWLWFYFVCSQVSKRTSASGNWHQHKFTARESWSSKEFRFSLSICYFNYLINRFVSVCMYIYIIVYACLLFCVCLCVRERKDVCLCMYTWLLFTGCKNYPWCSSFTCQSNMRKMHACFIDQDGIDMCGIYLWNGFFSLCIVTYVKTVA